MSTSVFKFETSNRLIQIMKFPETNEFQTIVKEINENGMLIESMEMNGIHSTRIYKRI